MEPLDLLILGGGPAGCAAALTAARLGLRVQVLERHPQRSKPGDALPPQAAPILQKLGVVPDPAWAVPTAGLEFRWGNDAVNLTSFPAVHQRFGLALHREAFEQHLRTLAAKAGAKFSAGVHPERVQETATGWRVSCHNHPEVLAHFVLDATGRQAWFARQLGISRIQLDAQVALFRMNQSVKGPPWIQVHSETDGWWYTSQLPQARSEMFFTVPETPAYLASIREGGWKAAAASTSFLNRIAGKRWLAVGDAAFTFDPIASQGISQALSSGYYAALAARDVLNGKTEAGAAYALTLLKATDAFFREWRGIYQTEQRFAGSLYWKSRHQLPEVQLPWWEVFQTST
ncbi:NAD(P)/FAD-dependent oxidoreductase [Deinococcus roseus]|uniref:Alkylhalidase-like protein n=1 Tax=Deinococcus roseus TaxID=392414 RepID=A0ABQ2CWA4_9DEIO|nr:FAD-dependent monooxygenase [Deinococcus roseus]GGJ26853.1 alkylhalidase-like protein [Deinococcus roseus]